LNAFPERFKSGPVSSSYLGDVVDVAL